eukprot:g3967.t1
MAEKKKAREEQKVRERREAAEEYRKRKEGIGALEDKKSEEGGKEQEDISLKKDEDNEDGGITMSADDVERFNALQAENDDLQEKLNAAEKMVMEMTEQNNEEVWNRIASGVGQLLESIEAQMQHDVAVTTANAIQFSRNLGQLHKSENSSEMSENNEDDEAEMSSSDEESEMKLEKKKKEKAQKKKSMKMTGNELEGKGKVETIPINDAGLLAFRNIIESNIKLQNEVAELKQKFIIQCLPLKGKKNDDNKIEEGAKGKEKDSQVEQEGQKEIIDNSLQEDIDTSKLSEQVESKERQICRLASLLVREVVTASELRTQNERLRDVLLKGSALHAHMALTAVNASVPVLAIESSQASIPTDRETKEECIKQDKKVSKTKKEKTSSKTHTKSKEKIVGKDSKTIGSTSSEEKKKIEKEEEETVKSKESLSEKPQQRVLNHAHPMDNLLLENEILFKEVKKLRRNLAVQKEAHREAIFALTNPEMEVRDRTLELEKDRDKLLQRRLDVFKSYATLEEDMKVLMNFAKVEEAMRSDAARRMKVDLEDSNWMYDRMEPLQRLLAFEQTRANIANAEKRLIEKQLQAFLSAGGAGNTPAFAAAAAVGITSNEKETAKLKMEQVTSEVNRMEENIDLLNKRKVKLAKGNAKLKNEVDKLRLNLQRLSTSTMSDEEDSETVAVWNLQRQKLLHKNSQQLEMIKLLNGEISYLEQNFENARKALFDMQASGASGAGTSFNTTLSITRNIVTNLQIESVADEKDKAMLQKIKKLYQQNRQLKAKVAALQFKVAKVKSELEPLRSVDAASMLLREKSLKREVSRLKLQLEKFEHMTTKVGMMEVKVEQLNVVNNNLRRESTEEQKASENKLKKLQRAIEKITRENAQASGSARAMIQEQRELERKRHLLQVEVNERDEKIKELELQLRASEMEVNTSAKMIKRLKNNIKKMSSEAGLGDKLEAQRKLLEAEFKSEMSNKEDMIISLNDRVRELKNELTEERERGKSNGASASADKQKLLDNVKVISDLTEKCNELETSLENAEIELRKQRENSRKSGSSQVAVERELRETRDKVSSLETQIVKLQKECDIFKKNSEKAEERAIEAEKKIAEAELIAENRVAAAAGAGRAEAERLMSELNAMQKQLKDSEAAGRALAEEARNAAAAEAIESGKPQGVDMDLVRMGARFAASAVKRAQTSCLRTAMQHQGNKGGSFNFCLSGLAAVQLEKDGDITFPKEVVELRSRTIDVWISSGTKDISSESDVKDAVFGVVKTFSGGECTEKGDVIVFDCGKTELSVKAVHALLKNIVKRCSDIDVEDCLASATMKIPPVLERLVNGGSTSDNSDTTAAAQLQVVGQIAAWNAEMLGAILTTLVNRSVGQTEEIPSTELQESSDPGVSVACQTKDVLGKMEIELTAITKAIKMMKKHLDRDAREAHSVMRQLELLLAELSPDDSMSRSFLRAQKRMREIRERERVAWERTLLTLGHLDDDFVNELALEQPMRMIERPVLEEIVKRDSGEGEKDSNGIEKNKESKDHTIDMEQNSAIMVAPTVAISVAKPAEKDQADVIAIASGSRSTPLSRSKSKKKTMQNSEPDINEKKVSNCDVEEKLVPTEEKEKNQRSPLLSSPTQIDLDRYKYSNFRSPKFHAKKHTVPAELQLCQKLFSHPAARIMEKDFIVERSGGPSLPPDTGFGIVLLSQRSKVDGVEQTKLVLLNANMPRQSKKVDGTISKVSSNTPMDSDIRSRERQEIAMQKILRSIEAFACKFNSNKFPSDLKPLSAAAKVGALFALRELLRSGCDVNESNSTGYTPLMHAIWSARKKCCIELLQNGADIDARTEDDNTALHFAYLMNRGELAEILLRKGAQSIRNKSNLLPRELNAELHREILSRGFVDRIENSNAADEFSNQKLANARLGPKSRSNNNGRKMTEKKLDKKASSRPFRNTPRPPLQLDDIALPQSENLARVKPWVVEKEKGRSVSIDPHCDPTKRWSSQQHTKMDPLAVAALHGDVSTVAHLIEERGESAKKFIDSVDENGSTPLIHATRGCQLGIVQLLLDSGSNVQHANKFGNTALHVAFAHSQLNIAIELLDFGANPGIKNKAGATPQSLNPEMHMKLLSEIWDRQDAVLFPRHPEALKKGYIAPGEGLPEDPLKVRRKTRSLSPKRSSQALRRTGNFSTRSRTTYDDEVRHFASTSSKSIALPGIHKRTTLLGTRSGGEGVAPSGRPLMQKLTLVEQRRRYKQDQLRGSTQYY